MSRLGVALLALTLVTIACGDDDGIAVADPASLTSCEDVADQSNLVLADTLVLIDALSPTEASIPASA